MTATAWISIALGALGIIITILATTARLGWRMGEIKATLRHITKNDLPHLAKAVDSMSGEVTKLGTRQARHDERIEALERGRKQGG